MAASADARGGEGVWGGARFGPPGLHLGWTAGPVGAGFPVQPEYTAVGPRQDEIGRSVGGGVDVRWERAGQPPGPAAGALAGRERERVGLRWTHAGIPCAGHGPPVSRNGGATVAEG